MNTIKNNATVFLQATKETGIKVNIDKTKYSKLPVIQHVWRIGDHAIAKVVSYWLPSVAARVRSQVMSCGICDGLSGTGAGFL
jgi:hypothetical protein